MEAAVECDTARIESTGQVVDFVGHGIPFAIKLFWGRFRWRFDRMAFRYQRVEIYHGKMIMQRFEDRLP